MSAPSSNMKINTTLIPFYRLLQHHDISNIAIISEGNNPLTYGELNDKIIKLAYYLSVICKINKGDLIAVRMNKSPDFIIAIFALWTIGAAYLPLDSKRHTEDEQIELFKHSGAKYLLTEAKDSGILHFLTYIDITSILTLQQFERDIKSFDIKSVNVSVTRDDLAYVIYTSGSSAAPKGVEIAHRGLTQFFESHKTILDIHSKCIIAQYASWGFDSSLAEILMAFGCGATLCIIPELTKVDHLELMKFYNEKKITHAIFVPKVLSYLNPSEFPFLRGFIITGEKYPKSLFLPWLNRKGSCLVVNGYGPTETTIGCSVGLCSKDGPIGLGKPIGDMRMLRWHSGENRFYRDDEPGEGLLYVSGMGLMLGYRNNKELTDKVLIPMADHANRQNTMLFYNTGDLAHLEQGELVFSCRLDRVKKICGKLVNLDDVEKIIQEKMNISNAVIERDEQIIAYLCVKDEFTVKEIINRLKAYLPDYKMPSKVAILNTLPLLSRSEKVNYKILETTEYIKEAKLIIDFITPSDVIENIIAEVWSKLTNIPVKEIYLDSNYIYHLGKGSLDVASMLREIRVALKNKGLEDGGISLESFGGSHHVTLAYIARFIRRSQYKTTFTKHIGRVDGANPTIYLVHSVTGDATTDYNEFLKELDIDTEIICINARKLNDIGETIEEIAFDYANIILANQKNKNPCYLIGWSSGGIIARETAKFLNKQGIICQCSMLDSSNPEHFNTIEWDNFVNYCGEMYKKLQSIYIIGAQLPIDYFSNVKSRKNIMIGLFDLLLAQSEEINKENIKKARAIKLAEFNYSAYDKVPFVVLHTAELSTQIFNIDLGWGKTIEQSALLAVRREQAHQPPVNHFSLMQSRSLKQDIKEQYQKLYISVIKRLHLETRYEDSLSYLTTLLKYKRNDNTLLMLRGRAFAHIADRELALVEFTKVITNLENKQQTLDSLYIRAILERGITYQRLAELQDGNVRIKNFENSIADFELIIKLNTQHAEAHYQCAVSYFNLNRILKGFQMIDQALMIDSKNPYAYCVRGEQYMNQENYEKAISDFESSLSYRPNHKQTESMLKECTRLKTIKQTRFSASQTKNNVSSHDTSVTAKSVKP